MVIRQADLDELELSGANDLDEGTIRKAYLRLSRRRHPDKGGTKEGFQNLVNAYERLIRAVQQGTGFDEESDDEASASRGDHDEYSYDETEESYWYGRHYDFFPQYWSYFNFSDEEGEDYFSNWYEEKKKERAKRRQEDLKRGYDYRDSRASSRDAKCMFCGVNKPITKGKAERNGLNWKEYTAHPDSYRTCWICKDTHKSVMTERQACKAFAKKLDYTVESKKTGSEYRPVFWFLKLDKKSFHQQPVTQFCEGPTRNIEYYWYPDLEREALSLGWKPRGEKKKEVPWERKDLSSCDSLHVVTPEKRKASGQTKRRRAHSKRRRLQFGSGYF